MRINDFNGLTDLTNVNVNVNVDVYVDGCGKEFWVKSSVVPHPHHRPRKRVTFTLTLTSVKFVQSVNGVAARLTQP